MIHAFWNNLHFGGGFGASLRMAALAALFGWSSAGNAAVKVVGGSGEPGFGYWVQYEIDGTKYRSDTESPEMNLEAWRLMSDEDKSKVVDYYGWQLNDRREDFGVDGSEEVAQWVDEKQGWAALYERLTADWLKVDFPGYAERFHRDVRSDYFIEHFVPECMFAEPWTNEMQKMYEAELMCFSWACEAYEALERYNAYHRTAAVQVISGELIEIITDKVLVPRITPSSAIEVSGTIYGIIKEGVGAASDIFSPSPKRPTG